MTLVISGALFGFALAALCGGESWLAALFAASSVALAYLHSA